MTATVRLADGTRLAFDALPDSRRLLLSFESEIPGSVQTCKLIAAKDLPAVIASLQLIAKQLAA